ncbi:helix-turn-helix transcriptional regulator [Clostridium botulinum]|nr:helix-turn-helix transcriptional regulator [Clostridium botulinum]NFP29969.1 helix-turn-helix transcriptional regulator [Clostridium botulinum]
MNIGERIKHLRNKKGLTQEELASKCGLSKNGIWNYENNKRQITIETLNKILTALDVSQEEYYQFIFDLYNNLLDRKTTTTEKALSIAETLESNAISWRDNVIDIESKPKYLLNSILNYLENTEEYYSSIFVNMLNSNNDEIPYFTDEQINNITKKVTDIVKYEIYKIENNIP